MKFNLSKAKEALRTAAQAIRIVRHFMRSGWDLDVLEKRLTCAHDWTKSATWKWNEEQGRDVPVERIARCIHCKRTEIVEGEWLSFDGKKVTAC